MNIIRWKRQARTTLRTGFWQALLVCMAALFLGGTAASVAGLTPYTLHGILQFFVTDGGAVQVLIFLLIFELLAGGPIAVGRTRYFLQAVKNSGGDSGEGIFKGILGSMFIAFRPRHYVKIAIAQLISTVITAAALIAPLLFPLFFGGDWHIAVWIVIMLVSLAIGLSVMYRFRLLPYIQAKEPDMPIRAALSKSNLWSTRTRAEMFKLDLSFLGLYILAPLTFGIGLFFVIPYHQATMAQYFAEIDELMTQHPDGLGFTRLTDLIGVDELNKLKA